MYRDNSLIPSEAIRLLALGVLAGGDKSYAELAGQVRHFVSHITGPSLELVASPLELLKIEGLVESSEAHDAGDRGDAPDSELLRLSEAGRDELHTLLTSNVRAPVSDINKLIITLKMRFLHLLEPGDRCLQAEILIEMCERQLVRLTELRAHHAEAPGHLSRWLDHEIDQSRARLDWFRDLRESLG